MRTLQTENLRKITLKEINTLAGVAIWVATCYIAKLAVVDTNAPVLLVWFIIIRIPLTIRGRIAVQPVGDIVPRFRF